MISPSMKDNNRIQKFQWIPWEISFSLKETTRNDQTSHTNAICAIVLPDKNGSPFEITDGSLKEAAPEKDWKEKAKAKIKAYDIVILMVGPKTYKAFGVLKEVKIANAY